MNVEPTSLPGCLLITPDVYPDERGAFFEHYNKKDLMVSGIVDEFIQDSVSISKLGVLRGLHFQNPPFAQGKLVSVLAGKVYDVAVDVRPDSSQYGQWVGVTLDDQKHQSLYIPAGFAHGFLVLSPTATFFYKISGNYYRKDAASGIAWNDPKLKITWPLNQVEPLLSAQDRKLPPLPTTAPTSAAATA